MNIPTKEDWGEYWLDIDQSSAYKTFFGKSNLELQKVYFENGQEIMTEIRFMPVVPFRYYVFGLSEFISAGNFPKYEAADFTSYFLDMIELVLKLEPDKVGPLIDNILPTVKKIARDQHSYDAPVDLYGDYQIKADSIISLIDEMQN
jgi:hypothetical protein